MRQNKLLNAKLTLQSHRVTKLANCDAPSSVSKQIKQIPVPVQQLELIARH